jgi:hypothetical protein
MSCARTHRGFWGVGVGFHFSQTCGWLVTLVLLFGLSFSLLPYLFLLHVIFRKAVFLVPQLWKPNFGVYGVLYVFILRETPNMNFNIKQVTIFF